MINDSYTKREKRAAERSTEKMELLVPVLDLQYRLATLEAQMKLKSTVGLTVCVGCSKDLASSCTPRYAQSVRAYGFTCGSTRLNLLRLNSRLHMARKRQEPRRSLLCNACSSRSRRSASSQRCVTASRRLRNSTGSFVSKWVERLTLVRENSEG